MDQEVLGPRRKASKASVWKSKEKGGMGGQCLTQERPNREVLEYPLDSSVSW